MTDTKSLAGSSETKDDAIVDLFENARRGGFVIGRPAPLLKRPIRPDLSWDNATLGLTFPPLEYRVGERAISRHRQLMAQALGQQPPGSDLFAPPTMFADEPMQCVATLFGRSGRLHASHEFEVISHIPAGSLVRSRGRIADRMERNGRKFVVVECMVYVVAGDDEIPALRIRATLLP